MFSIEFGAWVRQLRQAQGYDLQTMNQRTGISASTLTRLEHLSTHARLTTALEPFAILKPARPAQTMNTVSLDHAEQLIKAYESERKGRVCQWLVAGLNAIVSESHAKMRSHVAGEQGRILALYWEACCFLARFDPLQLLEDGRTISTGSHERDPQRVHAARHFRLALLSILTYRWNQGLFGKEACLPRWP